MHRSSRVVFQLNLQRHQGKIQVDEAGLSAEGIAWQSVLSIRKIEDGACKSDFAEV